MKGSVGYVAARGNSVTYWKVRVARTRTTIVTPVLLSLHILYSISTMVTESPWHDLYVQIQRSVGWLTSHSLRIMIDITTEA